MRSLPLWLIGLFGATLALGTDEFVVAGLLPEVASDLDISIGAAGQLITAFALAFALGAPVLAVALEPLPRRPVLLSALALFALANVGAALAPGLAGLLALRVIAGLAAACVSTSAFAIAAFRAPAGRQGSYLAAVTAGLTVALFTGVPFGTAIGSLVSWRATFAVVAAVAAVVLLILAVALPEVPGAEQASLRKRLTPLRSAAVSRLVLAVTFAGAGGLMFYSYLAPVLIEVHGNVEPLPWLLLLVGVVGLPSALLGGRLADRWGGRRARLVILGGHAVALATLGLALGAGAGLGVLIAMLGLWSLFAWALNPPLQASIIDAAPAAPMAALSLNISGLYLGAGVGGALGGAIVEGPGAVALTSTAAALLAAAWISALGRAPHIVPAHV